MDKFNDIRWRAGLVSFAIVIGIIFFFFLLKPEWYTPDSRISIILIFGLSFLGAIVAVTLTRFWAGVSDGRGNGVVSRWYWYSIAVVCIVYTGWIILEVPNIRNEALLAAAGKEKTNTIIRLLNEGADPNYLDKHGRAVIFNTISQNDTLAFKTLLDHGANWNAKNYNGVSILTYTLYLGEPYDTCTSLLLKHGAKPDFLERADVEKNYNSYLHRQAQPAAEFIK